MSLLYVLKFKVIVNIEKFLIARKNLLKNMDFKSTEEIITSRQKFN